MQRYATALRSNDLSARQDAVRELCELGPDLPLNTIDILLELLGDADETVRDGAAEALVHVARVDGPGRARVVQGLGDQLLHPEDEYRVRAVGIVSRVGAPAALLVPLLVEALKDHNRVMCRVSAEALCQIGKAAIPALQIAQVDPARRAAAKWVLARIRNPIQEIADTAPRAKRRTKPAISVPPGKPAASRTQAVRRPGIERRGAPRFDCAREVFYQVVTRMGQDLWWNARIVDVSATGIGLALPRAVSAGDHLAVDLREAHDGVERNAVARVVHARERQGVCQAGCSWLGPLGEDDLALLRDPAPK
jgi:hypothetical protein